MGILSFKVYSFLSIVMAGGAILNSVSQHEQFFPTVIHLTTQKSNILIISNFFLMTGLAILIKSINIFFGEVREIEKLSILDNVKRKLLDVFVIILIYREGFFDQSFFFWMVVLVFFWIIHQLTIKRSEYLIAESVTDHRMHFKLCFMYIFTISLDSIIVRYLYSVYMNGDQEKSMFFLLFFFEFVLISLNMIYPLIKYFVNAFEMFSYSNFINKNNILMVLEFIFSIIKLVTQLIMRFQFQFYIPFMIDHIETIHSLYQTFAKFISSIKLLRLLNKLPDISTKDIENIDNTCLICLSEITEGKKIGCGHIFHKNCLRELIQGKANQVCPKCRKPIQFDQSVIQMLVDQQNNQLRNIAIQREQFATKFNNKLDSIQIGSQQTKQFAFNQQDIILVEGNSELTIDNLILNIKTLINENVTPKEIIQIKKQVNQIFLLDQLIKDNNLNELKDQNNPSISQLFDFSDLLANSSTNLSKCGAISYSLPREASYNRSIEDESLRLRIELMNYLLISCHHDLLFQSIFFGATSDIIGKQDKKMTYQKEEEEEEQKNNTSPTFQNSAQNKIYLVENNDSDIPLKEDVDEKLIDEFTDENQRRLAWIELLQHQVSSSSQQGSTMNGQILEKKNENNENEVKDSSL